MSSRLLILMRHGEPDYQPESSDENGTPDGPLTERGVRQAEFAGRRLADRALTALQHSTLERTTHTARLVHAQLRAVPMRAEPLLREVIPNVPPAERLTPAQREFFAGWPAGVLDRSAARAVDAVARFARPPDDPSGADIAELLVTHGNMIAWFVADALGAPDWAWITMPTHACGALSAIAYHSARPPTLLAYNDTGHLPVELRALDTPAEWRF